MHSRYSKLLFPASAFLLAVPAALAANPLQIKTDKGEVEGTYTADQQVRVFKGIPYAAPPVGDLRWQAPQPAVKWKGVRAAHDFGNHCVQTEFNEDMNFRDAGPSEDCLTLNVWTPANAGPDARLPVMVWIYGGGFSAGSASEPRQDGQFLAHRNVIVVSMNYRLGIFGFFVHPALTAESTHHASGNYGLLDQAAAITWVKKNIVAFGGDPANITIFGESAGSISVSAHMASPLTRDLLAKAIGESGGAFSGARPSFEPRVQRELRDTQLAQKLFGTANIADLRKLSSDDILKGLAVKTTPPARFGASIDGYFLPQSVPEIFAAGKAAHIPLLAGWNADEARDQVTQAKVPVTAASFTAQAETQFGPDAQKFLAVYPATTDKEAVQSAGDYAGARFITFSTWRWLEAHVDIGNAPTYRYMFDLGSPGDKFNPAALGAFHSDDIEYVFGSLDSRPQAVWRPEDRKLSDLMGSYWTNFARTGDPNGPGLPKWPTYKAADNWQVMHLDATSEAHPDKHRDRYLFLNEAWVKTKPAQ